MLFKRIGKSDVLDKGDSNSSFLPGSDKEGWNEQFGRLIAYLLVHREKMIISLHPLIYEFICGNGAKIEQEAKSIANLTKFMVYLSVYDEKYASQMRNILTHKLVEVFGYNTDFLELNNGAKVREDNKKEYVMEQIVEKLIGNGRLSKLKEIAKGVTCCKELKQAVSKVSSQILKLELEARMDLTPELVISRLKFSPSKRRWSTYTVGTTSRKICSDLEEVLQHLDIYHLSAFVLFCTGSACLNEQGEIEVCLSNNTNDQLPSSHTCSKQLILPDYKNIEKLKEKLLTAITYGNGYFGFYEL